MTVYFQDHANSRYYELNDDTPARTGNGKMGSLKDVSLPGSDIEALPGSDIEVYLDGAWVKGWLPGEPKTYKFEIECVSWEDERTVHGVIHDGLIKNHSARDSKLPWHKIIPPSKQAR